MIRLPLLICLLAWSLSVAAQEPAGAETSGDSVSSTSSPAFKPLDPGSSSSASAVSPDRGLPVMPSSSLLAKIKAKFSRDRAPGERTLYSISWEMKQDATLLKKECSAMSDAEIVTKSVSSTLYDYCACTAKIAYPQVHGLRNGKAMQAINDSLAARVEQDGCGTEKLYSPAQGRSGDRRITRFDIMLADEHFLSFLIWHDTYGAGAAHNNWLVEGASYDPTSGKALGLADLIAPEKLFEVNEKISETLASAYPESAAPARMAISPMREEIELADGANGNGFAAEKNQETDGDDYDDDMSPDMTPSSDAPPAPATGPGSGTSMPAVPTGKKSAEYVSLDGCSGCTYYLTPDGLEIVFQLYEVAPFAEGNPKILIGKEYLKKDISERL